MPDRYLNNIKSFREGKPTVWQQKHNQISFNVMYHTLVKPQNGNKWVSHKVYYLSLPLYWLNIYAMFFKVVVKLYK